MEEVEKIAEDFLKRKRNAGTIKIDSVRRTDLVTWVVKGNYSVVGSNRVEAIFTLEINEKMKEVKAYDFEDIVI